MPETASKNDNAKPDVALQAYLAEVEEEALVHKVLTIDDISTSEENKDGSWKDS